MNIQVQDYLFDASLKQITFPDSGLMLSRIRFIFNYTREEVIFNAIRGLSGTVAGSVLTLEYDTTAHADNDELFIIYNDTELIATRGLQEEILQAIEARDLLLVRMLSSIANPVWHDKASNQLRSVVSGTVAVSTVSSITTLSNITNIAGLPGQLVVHGINNMAWHELVRTKIS